MLAQNFMSATDLGIREAEHTALIRVLGMLERGDLKDTPDCMDSGDMLFRMDTCGSGCGTPACIGGWVATLMGSGQQFAYVSGVEISSPSLRDLYWNPRATGDLADDTTATVAQAATALRSFLVTGDPKWDEAMNG